MLTTAGGLFGLLSIAETEVLLLTDVCLTTLSVSRSMLRRNELAPPPPPRPHL